MKHFDTLEEIREYMGDIDCTSILFVCPDFATAFIGTTDDDLAVYSYDLMVDYAIEHGEDPDEAGSYVEAV